MLQGITGAGVNTVDGATCFDGDQVILTASQNDFAPSCILQCTAMHITPTLTGLNITGFAGDLSGRILRIINPPSNTLSFTLKNLSGLSAANHQMDLEGADLLVGPADLVDLYCPVGGVSGWILAGTTIPGAGGAGTVTSVSVPNDFVVATPTTTPAISHGALQVFASPAGARNNVDPTSGGGWPVGFDRVDVTLAGGNANWTGLLAGGDGQQVIITNTDAANNLVLNNQNAGSTAANRFRSAADITLLPGTAILVKYYTGTVNRWVVVP